MTCGTPVVASDIPGVRVPVTKSGTGQIVAPGDVNELAKALIAILEDPDAYEGNPEKVVQLSTPQSVAVEYETAFRMAQNKNTKPAKQESLSA